jgi:TnpA family transposase
MAHWQDRFLGIGELAPELSIFEIDFFQFSPADIAAIRKEFRPKYRIAVALQLGFMRLTGARLNAFNVVPRKLLSLVGEQVGETAPSIASLRTMYGRGNTRRDHQAWVMQWLKIKAHTKRQERMLFAALREASKSTESIDRLIATARQWLFDKSLLVPATSTLRDICIRAASDNESHIYQCICRAVSSEKRHAWETAIFEKRKDGATHLEWLQTSPKRRSQKNLRGLFQKIEYLTQLGVADIELRDIPMERLQIYARQLQHKRPSRFRMLTEITRTLQLVSFLRVTLSAAADAVLQLAGKLTSDIVSDATEQVKRAEGAILIDYRKILLEIFGLAEDVKVSAESLQTTLRKMSAQLQAKIHPTRAAAVRARLTDKIPAVRSLLRAMTDLPIQGATTERAIAGLSELKTLYARHASELPVKERDLAKGWKAHVEDAADRERAMRALEASTLFELRRGLRRGGCWLEYSNAYRSREQMLIPEEQWRAQRRRHLSLLRLPENPKEYLASLAVAAKEGMDAVYRALARGDLTVDKGEIHLPKLEKEDVPPPVAQARDAISTHIGTIQLPELLMEMDVQTRFSKTLLARVPRSQHELLLTYGALLGHGTEMNATEVALMIPSLTAPEISGAMKSLEAHGSIDKANTLITEFVDRLPLMKVWGDGKSASSDMMSLQASMHLWNARRDPRRKTASIGMYTHVSNQWPIIYHQPIVLGNRQVGAAIEGVVRQDRIDLDWLAVDTHGYTDVGMCIARMQTFDLCPQLANLRERRLTVPKGMKIPEALASVVDATLHVECIQERWDDLLRIAASISNGTVSAVQVLERFGSVAQGDPIYRAAKTMGRLLRTIYLCDFFTKPEFRREIHRVLNRGESVHTLQRAIHSGAIPHDRGRRPEEMHAISGSLALLTNLVIGWTSLQTQAALTALKSRGIVFSTEVLRHVSPMRYHNINFRGTFGFPVERYLVELLGSDDSRNLKSTHG